ncbi:serine/threonine-protein kinase [Parachaetomium inaequale]|uniref:Serine/threonine-protein kinase n=1 Tax=Parachaetomium inaequale TaxID=2588326 RepID=A0AAN6PSQ0_9PEZI|nr:serine/threonine-protein kinase [Parachaetomium inaequale]
MAHVVGLGSIILPDLAPIRYLGCRIRRGRITAIVLESLKWTLYSYAHERPSKFVGLDKEAFLAGVESAFKYLHSLGLAHNDINPHNIMMGETDDGGVCSPVLIDFDSCGLFGEQTHTGRTRGFADAEDVEEFVSLKRHDEFSLGRLREWWDEEHEPKEVDADED